MSPEEWREDFINSQLTEKEIIEIQHQGLYDKYVNGEVSFAEVCSQFKDQGV